MLLLTHDPNTIAPDRLQGWTKALAEHGWISHPKVIEEADTVNTQWVDETPEDMLLGTIVCAWPQETDAGPQGVKARMDELIECLPLAGLERTANVLKALVAETNALDDLIMETNARLPVRMRNAERRSPYTSWTGREERARGNEFELVWAGQELGLIHLSLTGAEHTWGSWAPSEFKKMETFLASRNIDVAGLPEPQSDGGGDFCNAIEQTVESLEREGIGCEIE